MPTPEEIDDRHELLTAILDYNATLPEDKRMPKPIRDLITAARDTLGYAAGCKECAPRFEQNFQALMAAYKKAGFKFIPFSSHSE